MSRLSRLSLPRHRPASLRRRVVTSVLVLLSVLLIGLFAAVDLVLQARLRSDLRTRLDDRVAMADQLEAALSPQQLVDRLKGDGVTAQLCTPAIATSTSSRCLTGTLTVTRPAPNGAGRGVPPTANGRFPSGGQVGGATPSTGRPAPARAAATPIRRDGSVLFVRTTLPRSGQVLTLAVDSSEVTATIQRLVVLEVIGGALALLIAALLLGRVVSGALRPLDDMTELARRIAAGDRGRRLGTARADTELGRTATAFDAMLDELEAALTSAATAQTQLKGFLSDISHEMRTPLTGLHATSELLLRDEPDAAGRERAYLSMVRETRRTSRLVDDMLTVARLDTGAPLAIERGDLVDVVRHEVERSRLLGPGLTFRQTGAAMAPVLGDPMRLGQILANLLDNARHASPATGVVVVDIARVESLGGGAAPGSPTDARDNPRSHAPDDTTSDRGPVLDARRSGWRVDVMDGGPGVPPEARERIFDRLVRLDGSRSRNTGGFGLGLPIARALARAHGGDLVCVPATSGARFSLLLPDGLSPARSASSPRP